MLGLKTMLKVGFVVHFCQKKHVFLKKEQKFNWVSPPLAVFLFIIRGLTLL